MFFGKSCREHRRGDLSKGKQDHRCWSVGASGTEPFRKEAQGPFPGNTGHFCVLSPLAFKLRSPCVANSRAG